VVPRRPNYTNYRTTRESTGYRQDLLFIVHFKSLNLLYRAWNYQESENSRTCVHMVLDIHGPSQELEHLRPRAIKGLGTPVTGNTWIWIHSTKTV
jgi:hypothetical protein